MCKQQIYKTRHLQFKPNCAVFAIFLCIPLFFMLHFCSNFNFALKKALKFLEFIISTGIEPVTHIWFVFSEFPHFFPPGFFFFFLMLHFFFLNNAFSGNHTHDPLTFLYVYKCIYRYYIYPCSISVQI